jgi:hypothetical protein
MRIEAEGPGILFIPLLARRQLLIGLAEIDDAGLAKAGLGADAFIHAAPGLERHKDQGDFARITAHLAAPAPITARLLAGNDAFLDQGHGNAPLGQFEGGRDADDAAANDGDRCLLRQFRVGIDGIGCDGHEPGDQLTGVTS